MGLYCDPRSCIAQATLRSAPRPQEPSFRTIALHENLRCYIFRPASLYEHLLGVPGGFSDCNSPTSDTLGRVLQILV